jgi:hypothetical protein
MSWQCIISLLTWTRVFLEKLIAAPVVKKIFTFLWTSSPSLDHHWTLSWARWIQSTSSHPIYYNIQFHDVLPHRPTPRSLKWSLLLFPEQNFICIYHLPLACYMTQSLWLDHPNNNICWGVQIMTLLITQFSPASSYVLSFNISNKTLYHEIA